MKKFKTLSIFMVLLMFLFVPTVYAHDVTLDSKGIIKIPNVKGYISGEAKIEIDASYGSSYTLEYQYVEIDDDTYEAYDAILNEQIRYEDENLPDDDASEDEQKSYEEEMAEYENAKQALLPTYTDSWLTSEGNSVPLDTRGIDSEKHYVLWVRVTKPNSTPVYQNKVIIYTPSTAGDQVASPSTGDNIVVFGVAIVAIAGIMYVSYRKMHA